MIKKVKTTQLIETAERSSIICDICGQEYSYNKDDSSYNVFEIQEFVSICFEGGYGSVFGDGNRVELDMCQHCFKEKLGQWIRVLDEE